MVESNSHGKMKGWLDGFLQRVVFKELAMSALVLPKKAKFCQTGTSHQRNIRNLKIMHLFSNVGSSMNLNFGFTQDQALLTPIPPS